MALSKNYTFRDLLAIGVLISSIIGSWYIVRHDLKRQDQRIRENAVHIANLSDLAHQIELRNAASSAENKATVKDVERLERQIRRYHRSR